VIGSAVFITEFVSVFAEGAADIDDVGVLCPDLGVDEDLIHPGVAAVRDFGFFITRDCEIAQGSFLCPKSGIALEFSCRKTEDHENVGGKAYVFFYFLQGVLGYKIDELFHRS